MDPTLMTGLLAIVGVLVGTVAGHRLDRAIRKEEREDLMRRAEGRVSANAYALRRQLHSWIRWWPTEGRDVMRRVRRITEEKPMDRAEARVHAILAESLNASAKTSRAAQRIFVAFYKATDALNETRNHAELDPANYNAEGGVDHEFLPPWDKRVATAVEDLEVTARALEELIHPRLERLAVSGQATGEH